MSEHIEMLLRAGVATVCDSDCASGIVLVRKPDSTWRLYVDLRRINKLTKRDLGPLPRVEDLLTWLAEATCFASLDMLKGYWQFPVEEFSQRFLAFVTSLPSRRVHVIFCYCPKYWGEVSVSCFC